MRRSLEFASRRLASVVRAETFASDLAGVGRFGPSTFARGCRPRAPGHRPWRVVSLDAGRERELATSAFARARGDDRVSAPPELAVAAASSSRREVDEDAKSRDDDDDIDVDDEFARGGTLTAEEAATQSQRDTAAVLKIFKVARAIRNRGHLSARLDPLGRSLGCAHERRHALVNPPTTRTRRRRPSPALDSPSSPVRNPTTHLPRPRARPLGPLPSSQAAHRGV